MFWFQLVIVLLLLAAVGWLAVGGGGHMSEPVPDRADLALPADRFIVARDLDKVRFSVGLRGYRMEEVDDVLDRLAREVEVRDRRIAELEGRTDDLPESAELSEERDGAVDTGAQEREPALDERAGAAQDLESGSQPAPDLPALPQD
jgi:DivIVA domain-containing protein